MENYYAVERSGNHLSHYGVKGMKWGVRRAIARQNEKALARNYKRAEKKLAKLNKKADVNAQTETARKMNSIAKKSAKVGAGAAAGLAGLHLGRDVNTVLHRVHSKKAADLTKQYWNALENGQYSGSQDISYAARHYKDAASAAGTREDAFNRMIKGNGGGIESLVGHGLRAVAAGGLGTAAVAKGKAIAAKRRTTAKGHAKAVAKRNAWQNEMDKAFKGTSYDRTKKNKARRG